MIAYYILYAAVVGQILLTTIFGVPQEGIYIMEEDDDSAGILVKEARNFGRGNNGGTGAGTPDAGSNIKFYRMTNIPLRTLKPSACKADKATCCKFICTTACNPTGTSMTDACFDAANATEPGTPCRNNKKCSGCKSAPAIELGPDCSAVTADCNPTASMHLCPH